MADLTDIQNYGKKFENQRAKLRKADIDERDRDQIRQWVAHLDADGERGTGTIVSLLNRIRLSAERAAVPLVEMDRADVDQLLSSLKRDHGLSEGTRRNYRKALKQFHRWRGQAWAEDITIGVSPDREVDPNDLLDDDEVQALLDAAENPRDSALIALLGDTGLRIGALASLRLRDVDASGRTTLVSINEEANVKDASGTVPLTWSESYLTSYLTVHPRRDEPDAPLLHKGAGYYDGSDDGALTYQYLSRRVKDVADRAGVDRDKCNLHNFRHTAISNWIREGLSEQAIKHRASWEVDSDMLGVYSAVRDEELNDQILDHYDIAPVDEAASSAPDIEECPRCGTALRGTELFCPTCTAPLSASAAEKVEDIKDRTFESVGNTDASNQDLLAVLRDRFKNDAELRAALVGMGHDDSSSE